MLSNTLAPGNGSFGGLYVNLCTPHPLSLFHINLQLIDSRNIAGAPNYIYVTLMYYVAINKTKPSHRSLSCDVHIL